MTAAHSSARAVRAARARACVRTRTAASALAALSALALAPAASALPAPATFAFTGAEQSYVVPAGVTSVAVNAIGGAGGAGTSALPTAGQGGVGGQAGGQFAVTPGETLFVEVGGNGGDGATTTYGVGGFNGGAGSMGFGAGGGGASDVRTSGCAIGCPGTVTSLASRLLVAAGGGGGGAGALFGGNGGTAQGDGQNSPTSYGTPGLGGTGASAFGPGVGGAGFTADPICQTVAPGANGTLGRGGVGSSTVAGGGGGGGGFFGGGGGSGCATGGGGGGGADYAAPSVTHTAFGLAAPGTAPSVTITPLAPATQLSAAALSFPAQALGTIGAAQTVTVTNTGTDALSLGALDATGAANGEFLLADSTCAGTLAPGQSCHFGVWFAPQVLGARTATLRLLTNDPAGPVTIGALGTGTSAPTGPQGPTGPAGPAGPRGAQGPAGATGALVCQNTTLARTLCAIEFAPGSVTIRGGALSAQYQLLSHGRVAAHGTVIVRHGRIVHTSAGRLARGAYVLVISTGTGRRRRVLLRTTVRIR